MRHSVLSFYIRALSVVFAMILGTASANAAEPASDSVALNGLKVAKTVFLLDFTNPNKTNLYLKVIQGTHAGLVRQGVKPHIVLVFIGKTVQYLTSKPSDDLAMEHLTVLQSIAENIKKLGKLGIRMEVCEVANKVFGIDNKTILPEMTVVGDGFISLIGWQYQGYKLVPVY